MPRDDKLVNMKKLDLKKRGLSVPLPWLEWFVRLYVSSRCSVFLYFLLYHHYIHPQVLLSPYLHILLLVLSATSLCFL